MLTTQHRVVRCAAALALASGLAANTLGADAHYRVVARTGQTAPGGGQFAELGTPVISHGGRVAFKGALSGVINPSGLWSEGVAGMNNLQLAARQGNPIPGLAGTFLGSIAPDTGMPIMNALGEVAFAAQVTGNQAVFGNDALFVHDAGGLDPIATPGQLVSLPCAGFGCQRWMTNIDPYTFAFNAAGQAAFHAQIAGTGVNVDNDRLVLVGDGADLDVLIREGDAPPGTFGVSFSGSTGNHPHLNDNGEALIRNYLYSDNGSGAFWSVWRGAPEDFSIVAAEGWTTPMGGEFWSVGIGFGLMSMNNAGDALFVQAAEFSEGDYEMGLWLDRDGALEAVCFVGMDAPGGFDYLEPGNYSEALNASGGIVFNARIQGLGVTEDTDNIIVRRDAMGAEDIIVREGAQTPGFLAGVHYEAIGWYGNTLLNDGRVVFGGKLAGPGIHEANDLALWITRSGAAPALLVREGQAMVIGGQLRHIESFSAVLGIGPESGYETGVSQLGQVSMLVEFTDGTQAIIVASPKGACPGDVNGDGAVDFLDLNIVLSAFNTSGDVVPGDLDLDGDVDFADLNLVLNSFNESCDFAPVAR